MPMKGPQRAGMALDGRSSDSTGASRPAKQAGRRLGHIWAALASGVSVLAPALAFAQAEARPAMGSGLFEVVQLAVFAGVTGAAMLSAIWLIRERGRTASQNLELRDKVEDLSRALQRSEMLLNLNDKRVVVWNADGRKPDIVGNLPAGSGVPDDRAHFLAFGRWLQPRSAAELEHCLAGLRERGETFEIVLETQNGTVLDAQGRLSGAARILRVRAIAGVERAHARLRLEHQQLAAERETLLGLVNVLAMPVWMRDAEGRLQWVNHAYAAAVEAETPEAAVQEKREFLGSQAREQISKHQRLEPVFAQKVATVVAGDRRVYSITDQSGHEGSAGIAIDVSDVEGVREGYERMVRSHAETLDQLSTAVAIFDSGQKLRFFNQAFQKLWEVDIAFLESAPEHALVLDRLRSDGKLAEQPEWRRWKESVLSAYRALGSQEDWWHLPDGRTIRVVANPQADGGVAWIFENMTERIDLETRYNTAVRVQGETLDNLAEGVAVFGPDGRIRLSNPAFATLWAIDPNLVKPGTHISAVRALTRDIVDHNPWGDFMASATGFDDDRRDRHGQIELNDGNALRYAVIHLPNGQVMLTFVDVTDSVNVERALKDKNEALQKADQLKNDFIQHVSYELRTPLTNISGYAEALAMPDFGPLNARQREYLGHIGASSEELRTIVDHILDLATLDAGIMQLEIAELPVAQTVARAAAPVTERMREQGIELTLDLEQAPRTFFGDEKRVEQILFNLLANAANHAPAGSSVTLSAKPAEGGVAFSVHDDGPGMPKEMLDSVFRRFEPRANGGRRRGAGLGLSIVKSFVELHGGSVKIDSRTGQGTTVTCAFPAAPSGLRAAAE